MNRMVCGAGRRSGAAVIAAVVFLVTGCSLNPAEITRGASSSGSQNRITLQFDTVLTLTDGAEVMVDGVEAGRVTSIDLTRSAAEVTVGVNRDVRIPADARAAVRQGTVLGDAFVSIDTTVSRSRTGEQARVIPLAQTASPPPLENTLAVLANFVNGGSIVDVQDVLRTVNKSFPEVRDAQRVASIVDIDMRSVATHTDRVDSMIAALNGVSASVDSRSDEISALLSVKGMHFWRSVMPGIEQLGTVIPSVGSIFEGGYWLVPALTEVNDSIGVIRNGIEAVGANAPAIEAFLTKNLFPFLHRPTMKVVSASSPDGQDVLKNAEKLLRMLGAIR